MMTNKKNVQVEIKRIELDVTDKLDITVWEKFVDEDADEGKQNKRRLIASFELPTRMLNAVNEYLYQFEEDLETKEEDGEYDGSQQQAEDDHRSTELAAIIRNQKE